MTARPIPAQMAVIIPAHNEQALIGDALVSVVAARRRLPPSVGCRVVVVADACTDDTVAEARRVLRPGSGRSGPDRPGSDLVVTGDHRCVGAARHHGVARVLGSSTLPLHRLWLASTDADTLVSPDWLVTQLALATAGWVGAAGVVELIDDHHCDHDLRRRFHDHYGLTSTSTSTSTSTGTGTSSTGPGTGRDVGQIHSHGHVHGANLGVRADAYRAVGGWRALATGEDHDLWRRLRRRGYGPRLLSTTGLAVRTSARRRGRAPSGFAADLVALDREAA